jgi:SAM-dependent methyltransferase
MGVVVDHHFAEPRLAELYDTFCAGRPDWSFYLPLVRQARSVLDIGCGTGELLRLAREQGHAGRLVGLDPAAAMLDVARRRGDIDWVCGDPASVSFDGEFELIVMTGNAFQVFIEDEDVRASLVAIRSFLSSDGHFAFDTRNPSAREWERWRWESLEVMHQGVLARMEGTRPIFDGRLLTFSNTYTSPDWDAPEVSHSTLRVFDVDELASFLTEAGLAIEEQCGDFEGQPLTDESLEIVTIARPA